MKDTVTEKQVRIVVVDDSHDFRELVISIVCSHPELQVFGQACDGGEAVARIQTLRPDLVLLDLGLPTLNGFEVARTILKTSPNSKIIIVSHESSAEIVQEAFCLGAHGYVLKSDVCLLTEAIKSVLDGRRFLSNGLTRGPSH